MGKGNNMYEEMDRITQRIRELVGKSGVGWYGEGDTLRESTLTVEEKQELEQLRTRKKELDKEDEANLG